ncbi:5bbc1424-c7c1-41e6-8606-bc8ce38587cb [Thermothielavioides terrestris]|uniref:5bbc1424-c7c1-41e6-8606-bc8ce38587cb n=1 Tax=Thermothielavioides terrestris TaxID=2587410 RepID=A0A446BRH5_9PEZI|nr:5bbc1424-c7c1-41e6-8606-bc8ce38587cb [Thermothielavioides terrestris]
MSNFLSQPVYRGAAFLRNKLGNLTWGPLVSLARSAVLAQLAPIAVGTLVIIDEPRGGERLVFGQQDDEQQQPPTNGATTKPNGTAAALPANGNHHKSSSNNSSQRPAYPGRSNPPPPPRVELTVRSEAFWTRLALFADMGFAEAYMLGEVDVAVAAADRDGGSGGAIAKPKAQGDTVGDAQPTTDEKTTLDGNLGDACASGPRAGGEGGQPGRGGGSGGDGLAAFFRLFVLNRDALGDGATPLSALVGAVAGLARAANTLPTARLNVAAHYDLGNDMFAAFLSPDMTYSCPIWREVRGEGQEESLQQAQMTKLQRFIDGARIKPTDHVLEIGTGWGSFAIEAVRQTGCRVTTLTLSREQKALAEARIAAEGFADRIEVLLMDYRALPVPETPYDKIVSIEMLEAVGEKFLGTYFARVHQLLKRDGGIAVFQCITMPEGRHAAYSRREDFINHYIFPGGYLPSITQLLNHITTESKGTLIVEKVENIGGHYARTLRLWREQFLANFDERIRPALMKQHPGMGQEDVEVFRRKWEYYFAYCEAGFVTKTLGDVIITVGREGAVELMEGIPL